MEQPAHGDRPLERSTTDRASHSENHRAAPVEESGRREALRAVARTVLLNVGLPTLIFYVLRGRVHDDAVALAIAGALPVARTVLAVVRGRPVEPLAVLSSAGFAVSLVIYLLTGGNPIAIELHEAVLTGSLGVGTILAVLLGFRVDQAMVHLAPPAARDRVRRLSTDRQDRDPAARRRATVVTLTVAITLVVHALVLLGISLSVPVASFVLLSRVIGFPILAVGVGAAALYGYGSSRRAADNRTS